MTGQLEQVRAIYKSYYAALKKSKEAHKPTDGLLGFGSGVKDDPCHTVFSDALEQALNAPPENETAAAEVLRFLCEEPLHHQEDSTLYWMLIAVQNLGSSWVDALSVEHAAKLALDFQSRYPVHEQLPAQRRFYTALCERGKIQKKRFINFLK